MSCQSERSQTQNKETAMKMLKSKLLDLKEKENKEKIEDLKGIQRDIAWGSQIRSYVFCPYTMVKDHRTNYEVGNIDSVMDGNLKDALKDSSSAAIDKIKVLDGTTRTTIKTVKNAVIDKVIDSEKFEIINKQTKLLNKISETTKTLKHTANTTK